MSNLTTTAIAEVVEEEITVMAKLGGVFIVIIIGTFSLNLYLIVIIAANKKLLQVPASMFMLSMCAVGILLACVDMPFQLAYTLDNYKWTHGIESCILWFVFDFSTCTVSLLNFMCIAFIRLMGIMRPSQDWAPRKIQILVLCLVWVVPFFGWTVSLNILFREAPPDYEDCYLSIHMSYSIAADVFAFLLPLVVLISINIKLMCELRKRKMKVIGTAPSTAPVTQHQIQPGDAIAALVHYNQDLSFNGDHPVTISSSHRTQHTKSPIMKEKRALLVLWSLQIGFLVCWLPFICSFPLDSLSLEVNPDVNNMIYWMAYFNSLYNAIVLICTSKTYQVLCQKSTYESVSNKIKNLKERFIH